MEIERLREALCAELLVLESTRRQVAPMVAAANPIHDRYDPSAFDNIDDDAEDDQMSGNEDGNAMDIDADTLPENRILEMPSTVLATTHPYCAIELELRQKQASQHLQALRETIADKSFQYSHVIRVAPRKSIHTRARAAIAKLNRRISYHCRVYSRCRAGMIRLGADLHILEKYRILERQDVQASTALLDPNQPGSSSMRLSWIWQTGLLHDRSSPDALQECMYHVC